MRHNELSSPPPSPLDRMQALAEHLTLLADQVRNAVAEAVSQTLSRLAHDAAARLLGPSPDRTNPHHSYGAHSHCDGDPRSDSDSDPQYCSARESSMESDERIAIDKALATDLTGRLVPAPGSTVGHGWCRHCRGCRRCRRWPTGPDRTGRCRRGRRCGGRRRSFCPPNFTPEPSLTVNL